MCTTKVVYSALLLVVLAINTKADLLLAATHPHIEFTGRVLKKASEFVHFDWPCVAFRLVTMNASSVSVLMNGGNNGFSVFVDGTFAREFKTNDQEEVLQSLFFSKKITAKNTLTWLR
jgi:hypothetical protein